MATVASIAFKGGENFICTKRVTEVFRAAVDSWANGRPPGYGAGPYWTQSYEEVGPSPVMGTIDASPYCGMWVGPFKPQLNEEVVLLQP